jgi:hypothetical protein
LASVLDAAAFLPAVTVTNATTVEVFRFSDHAVVMPATVYLRADGVLAAGQAASSPVGRGVDRLGSGFMGRLGDPTPLVVGGESDTVTDLLGILLRDVI